MHNHGSGEDKKGKGTGQRYSTESELQSEVKKIRFDLDALTTKVDKQAVLLANQVARTANLASSISKIAKETNATAQSVEYSNTLVKQLIDEPGKPEEKEKGKQNRPTLSLKHQSCRHRRHHHIQQDWRRQWPLHLTWKSQAG